MTKDQAQWWTRAAQSLSRAGLVWLALTAVTLASLISSGSGLASGARQVAASSVGSTGKLKANAPGAPTIVPGELAYRAQGPDTDAKRVHAGAAPAGLVVTNVALSDTEQADELASATSVDHATARPSAFSARAPPARA
jgi:hypothetical protein